MKTKKQLLISLISLALLLVFTAGVAFAWFLRGDNLSGLFFRVAKIDSDIGLYKANDFNFNGMPDLDENGRYSFSKIGWEYAQSVTGSGSSSLELSIEGFMPTQIRTYRIAVYNRSDADNTLRFAFDDSEQHQTFSKYLQAVSVKIGKAQIATIDGADILNYRVQDAYYETALTEYYQKLYFADFLDEEYKFKEFDETYQAELPVAMDGGTHTVIAAGEIIYFWLQFEFETFADLTDNVANSFDLTEADYQAAQGKSFDIPLLKVFLEIYR